jgi:MOSC domain-containing protein YiiM
MALTRGKVRSVNVGLPREFEYNGRPARSAIWKSPAFGRVVARGVNLAGDDQADRRAHGGPDKAVYAYAVEDLGWWARQVGRPLEYGGLGENLTAEGIDVNGALVGERWAIGTTVLEVSEPRVPCWRLGVRMNDKLFPRRFTEALRPGAYLRILGHVHQRLVEDDPGVVHEDVETPKPLECGVEQPHYFGRPAHVGSDGDGLAARLLDGGDGLACLLFAARVVDDHGGPVLHQPQGDGPADAAAGPGHSGDLPSKAHRLASSDC